MAQQSQRRQWKGCRLNTIPPCPVATAVRSLHPGRYARGEVILQFQEGSVAGATLEWRGGLLATGIPTLDALNLRFDIFRAEPIFSPPPSDDRARAFYEALGMDRIYRLFSSTGADGEEMVDAYRAEPAIAAAEPDFIGHGHATPSDLGFSKQWGLNNTGDNAPNPSHPGSPKPDADVDMPEAWNLRVGATTVSIIDTGIDWDHPDLDAEIWTNTDGLPQQRRR